MLLNTCTYTVYEQATTGMMAPNPHLFHYLFWEYHFYLHVFDLCPLFQNHNKGIKQQLCELMLRLFIFMYK